jgi:hypothetical protein
MEHKEDLIQYRIQRAEKTLQEAKWAIDKRRKKGARYPRPQTKDSCSN